MVNFLGDGEGIQKAILTGGAFAGDHRTNHGTSTSGFEPCLCDVFLECLDLIKRHALNFDSQTGGKSDDSVSKFFCCLSDHFLLFSSDFSIYGDNSR